MDKNTLTGLLLIGALLMGFMYCNRPDPEQAKNTPVEQTQKETAAAQTGDVADLRVAMIDAAQKFGTVDTAAVPGKKVYSVSMADVEYSVALGADTVITGNARLEGAPVDLAMALGSTQSKNTPEADAAARDAVRKAIDSYNSYGSLASNLGGKDSVVTVKTPNLNVSFSSRGGMVSKVVLNKYNTEITKKPQPVTVFDSKTGSYALEFQTATNRLNTAELNYKISQPNDTTVVMTLPVGQNATMGVRYTVDAANYLVKMDLLQQNIAAALPGLKRSVTMTWKQALQRNEVGRTFEERFSAIYYKMDNENPEDLDNYSDDAESVRGNIRWIAFKNQFFSSVIIARNNFSSAELDSKMVKAGNTLKNMTAEATFGYDTSKDVAGAFCFYFGPNDYPLLSDLDDALKAYAPQDDDNLQLNKLVQVGWGIFGWINRFVVIPVFSFLSGFISNYGIIILLLTLFIKLILFPLTYKSYMSQAKMRVLAPEIKEINEKYPNKEDALKKQQETMKLYSRAGASPFSGCLPMLLQMPILIAMFSFFPSAIELRGQSFLWVHDLSAPDYIFTLPFSLPFLGNQLSLFCLLMTATNIIYTRINMQSQPTSSTMPGMKWMMYLMPVMFLFFFNDYAAGLSYYYFLSLLITIVQTYIFRLCINEDKVRKQMLENAKKPKKKSGFMARLEAAQKKQEAMMREQARQNARRRR